MGCAVKSLSYLLPEQFTAVRVVLVVNSFLQDTAEMEGQPAESKDQHEAENRLCNFPSLSTKTNVHGLTDVFAKAEQLF